jgi:hypothetical protein
MGVPMRLPSAGIFKEHHDVTPGTTPRVNGV